MDKHSYFDRVQKINKEPKLTINATQVSAEQNTAVVYEFTLDLDLNLISCGYYQSVSQSRMKLINNIQEHCEGALFELNHIRVDPYLNNDQILHRFKKTLEASGIEVISPPEEILMAICYKPLGELNDTVRFYLDNNNQPVYLAKAAKLSVV